MEILIKILKPIEIFTNVRKKKNVCIHEYMAWLSSKIYHLFSPLQLT